MSTFILSEGRNYFVYIITNPSKTVLYTGMTHDLRRRLQEHIDNKGKPKTFAGKYFCSILIYYEGFSSPTEAILREKQIKGWTRAKKEILISTINPKWKELRWDI